jgi:murein DD-endopeptidase MepM/ murein hydrolase activator NlpD
MTSPPQGIRWGFGVVIFFMLGLSVVLTVSAGSRFSGIAWGHLRIQDKDESVSVDGFMVVDLSDSAEPERERGAVSMRGAAYAEGKVSTSTNLKEHLALPGGVDVFSALPRVESADLDLPSVSAMAFLPLPIPSEPTGDFGPLPKDLADFESIMLNTTENGMRLPDDSLEELPDMELPDDDIILAAVGANWKEHVVKSGETLSDIALLYGGVTTQDILRANGLKDANRLAAQQILLIPNDPEYVEDTWDEVRTRKTRVAVLREQAIPLQVVSYVVAAGDSLWSIANAQNLEVDTLVGSNVFKNSSVLHPGFVLRIPNQDGIFYRLKKGDKMGEVVKRYQVTLDKIRKVNPTTDLVALKAGDEIFLPGARPEAVAEMRVASKKTEPASSNKTGGAVQKASRSFRWPVMGKINSPFGWRRHPITKRRDFHTGLDIKAGRGTVIRSSREGKVAYSGWMGGYGKVVVVEHSGGQSTLYAHCSSLLVQQGAMISVGQNIARVGSTGRATGPHLHFEIRNGNSPVNPLPYLK